MLGSVIKQIKTLRSGYHLSSEVCLWCAGSLVVVASSAFVHWYDSLPCTNKSWLGPDHGCATHVGLTDFQIISPISTERSLPMVYIASTSRLPLMPFHLSQLLYRCIGLVLPYGVGVSIPPTLRHLAYLIVPVSWPYGNLDFSYDFWHLCTQGGIVLCLAFILFLICL